MSLVPEQVRMIDNVCVHHIATGSLAKTAVSEAS